MDKDRQRLMDLLDLQDKLIKILGRMIITYLFLEVNCTYRLLS